MLAREIWRACVMPWARCLSWQDAMIGLEAPHLQHLATITSTYPELAALLEKAINDNPPAVIRDGGVLKTGYDAELDELQSLSENAGSS